MGTAKAKPKEEEDRIIRAYPLQYFANQRKIDKVLEVLPEYRITAKNISNLQWRMFYEDGGFYKDVDVKDVESNLSARYKRNCCYQTVGILDSYVGNIEERFVEIVYRTKLDEQTKLCLFYINKYGLWFKKEVKMPLYKDDQRVKGEFVAIPEDIIFLARKIFKHIIGKRRKPSFKHINMQLNANVAKIVPKESDKASKFDYWIRFSTLEKNKPVYIPFVSNKYFDSIDGNILNSCQFNFDEDNSLKIYFTKEVQPESYSSNYDKVALDIGLNTFVATNLGDLFGRSLYDKLLYYDSLLQNIVAERQRINKPIKTERYKNIVKIVRSLLKNEVGRIINRIVELYHPKEIVIENLDFRDTRMSKQLNRIIRNFGMRTLKNKLESLKEILGIEITYVNPAYTSKECVVCGYADERNRNGEKFKCLFCGHKSNADVDGARSVLDRSSDKEITVLQKPGTVLKILRSRFFPIGESSTWNFERQVASRRYSTAYDLLSSNKYFKNCLPAGIEGFL